MGTALATALGIGALVPATLASGDGGRSVYETRCAACHRTGLLAAPRLGVADDWKERVRAGRDALVQSALSGVGKMPPKGGNPGLDAQEVAAAVDHMLEQLTVDSPATDPAPDTPVPERAISKAPAPTPAPVRKARRASGVNAFNRLMRPPAERNPPPAKDGIHDPASEGTAILQAPRESFGPFAKTNSGNRVDWVRALADGEIAPRFDLKDAAKSPVVMDLNIVREVKGSMPDVVYPHKQHTEWLDCSNCHTEIFVPKKGANQMSMAGILLGQGCGVCHGKVAFPVADCRRCHSRDKPEQGANR